MWHAIWHPFLTGRLARWRQVEKWLENVLSERDVWFESLGEIATYVRQYAETGGGNVRRDNLPFYTAPPAQTARASRDNG